MGIWQPRQSAAEPRECGPRGRAGKGRRTPPTPNKREPLTDVGAAQAGGRSGAPTWNRGSAIPRTPSCSILPPRLMQPPGGAPNVGSQFPGWVPPSALPKREVTDGRPSRNFARRPTSADSSPLEVMTASRSSKACARPPRRGGSPLRRRGRADRADEKRSPTAI